MCAFHCKLFLTLRLSEFLGRHFDRVDIIKPVSNVRPSVRAYVRPQKVSLISMKFCMYVGVDE